MKFQSKTKIGIFIGAVVILLVIGVLFFCIALFVLMLFGFSIISVTYHLRHRCTVLLTAVHFSVDLQWYA